MPTPYSAAINRFFHRIEEDRDFFQYFALTDDEAMALAHERAKHYLENASDRIMLECQPSFDFSDRDDKLEQFNGDLNKKELLLLSSLMYEYYLDKDISKIKTYEVNYTGTELRVFSPSEARTSFKALYEHVCKQNLALMDTYRNTDRESGEYKGITYTSYDSEE